MRVHDATAGAEPAGPWLSLYAEFEALDGSGANVRDLLAELAVAVRAEPGNLVFDAWTRTERPHEFVVFESYRDLAAFEAHLSSPHSVAFNRRLAPLVSGGASRLTWLDPI